ncbi:uncharacterized protein BKA55DRAFT_578962, partial [Fusarium redolens]
MRPILILSALQGAALAIKDETHTKVYCKTKMWSTEGPVYTITTTTKVKVTGTLPRCRSKPATCKITPDPVTTTVIARSIYPSLVTAPQKIDTLTITKTR